MEKIGYSDFGNVCRLCLNNLFCTKVSVFSKAHTRTIKSDDGDDDDTALSKFPLLIDLIVYCTAMNADRQEELPEFICLACLNKLLNYTKFREKCCKSKTFLTKILKAEKINGKLVTIKKEDLEYEDNSKSIENYKDLSTKDICSNHINLDCLKEPEITENELKQEQIIESYETGEEHVQNNSQSNFVELDGISSIEKHEEHIENEDSISIENAVETQTIENNQKNIEVEKKKSKGSNVKNIQKSVQSDKSRKTKKEDYEQCQVCGNFYRQLTVHVKLHEGIKNFKCEICNKSFTANSTLKDHMIIHSNDRPFQCKYCERAFKWKLSLKSHELQHTKEKNYQCDICNATFLYPSSFHYHKKLHFQIRQHKCDICAKEFIAKRGLRQHYRIHTGEKPYECKECGKKFTLKFRLSDHEKNKHCK